MLREILTLDKPPGRSKDTAMQINVRQMLEPLGLELPPAPPAVADYVPGVSTEDTLYISGQLPLVGGKLVATGKVGAEVDLATAQACAQRCALNALSIIDQQIGGEWRRFKRLLKLTVFVASAPGFTDQHLVANGASEFMGKVLRGAGKHARSAVGCVSLPLDAPVEVELIVEVLDDLMRSD